MGFCNTISYRLGFRDSLGNTNLTPYLDTIVLDTTAPADGTVTPTAGNSQIALIGV